MITAVMKEFKRGGQILIEQDTVIGAAQLLSKIETHRALLEMVYQGEVTFGIVEEEVIVKLR
jgi:hypothetical protein